MIKQEDVAKILEAAKIEDVVGAFVPLKKRGANYIGLCPFHNEKTPSFNVNPAKGIFKCFGCGEGGDAVGFVMKHEHYSYPEALRWLAARYHIQIEEKEATPEEKAAQTERNRLFHINEFAQRYFQNLLFNDPEGKRIGLSYFKERGLEESTIKKWGLGYCKDSWDDFIRAAKAEEYSEEDLVKAGVAIKNENTNSIYDRFRARVTFPIYNIGGRVLGFSARILSSDKSKAKYVNSPESPIYSKGKVLFGLHLAKDAIVKQDLCYLVEGNMDAVMMSQNGVSNVVATSGTALTPNQIALIKRYTRNVTVLYDGDSAGIKATFKAVNLFLENGLNVRTVLFPDGEDPDSFARKHTMNEFKDFLFEHSENFIIYKTNLLMAQAQDDPIKRADLIKDIVHTISLVPDTVERSTYLQQCSKVLDVQEAVLNDALNKQLRQNAFTRRKEEEAKTANAAPNPADVIADLPSTQTQRDTASLRLGYEQEKAIISILFRYGDRLTSQEVLYRQEELKTVELYAANFVVCDIVDDGIEFEDEVLGKIFEQYRKSVCEEEKIPDVQQFVSSEDAKVRSLAAEILIGGREISPLWEERIGSVPNKDNPQTIDKEILDTLLSFKLYKVESYIKDAAEKIRGTSDPDEQLQLLSRSRQLCLMKDKINKKLSRNGIPNI